MRIFLRWNDLNPDIVKKLKRQSNEIVYWMGGYREKYRPPEIIFHNALDALQGIPAKGVDVSKFPPPEKDLIERLYKVESLILTMMNRSKTGKLRTDERKHLYYNMLQYWYGVLKKYKPDIIIYQVVPHDICSYLIYELAHLLKIKTVMFYFPEVADRILTYTDFWKGSDDLHKELQKNQGKNFSLKELSSDLQEHYKLYADTMRDVIKTPMSILLKKRYSRFNLFRRRLKKVKNSVKEGDILKLIIRNISKRFKQNLKKEYHSVQIKPDFSKSDLLNKKFIYVPLQAQPELTTSPLGGIFVDQILMIETLSASLPPNWVIYIKEHPTQWPRWGSIFSNTRYQGYYKKMAQLKNVYIVPIKTDAYTLIDKSQAVAVVTGRSAWEAMLRSKPAIVFGYPWYKNCSEVFRVRDIESCKKALKKIANGFTVNQQKIINYLKCLDNATIHGYFIHDLVPDSKLTEKESRNNIIQKILLEMKRE